MSNAVQILAAATLIAMVAACSESSPFTGPVEEPPVQVRTIKAAPSFSIDIQEIMERTACGDSGCHGTGQGSLYLGNDAADNYEALVNVQAVTERQFTLVKPFDADSSYVIMRFENRQMVGLPRMPVGPPLDSIDLTNWRNWINNGAPNN